MKISASILSDELEVLQGVNIINLDTKASTQTNQDGKFSIDVASPATKLQISHVGYETKTMPAGNVGSYVALPIYTENLETVEIENNYKPKKSDYTGWYILTALLVGYGASRLFSSKDKTSKEVKTLKI